MPRRYLTLTPKQQQRFEKLLTEVDNTSFACGEWDRNETDEPFDALFAKSNKAQQRLREFVCGKPTGESHA